MTKEEAINILTREIDEDIFIKTPYREQIHEALNTAIEDIKLQIPNEWKTEKFNPIYVAYKEPADIYECTDCKNITDFAYNYCPYCGKAKIERKCTNCKYYNLTCECPAPCNQETKRYWQLADNKIFNKDL